MNCIIFVWRAFKTHLKKYQSQWCHSKFFLSAKNCTDSANLLLKFEGDFPTFEVWRRFHKRITGCILPPDARVARKCTITASNIWEFLGGLRPRSLRIKNDLFNACVFPYKKNWMPFNWFTLQKGAQQKCEKIPEIAPRCPTLYLAYTFFSKFFSGAYPYPPGKQRNVNKWHSFLCFFLPT